MNKINQQYEGLMVVLVGKTNVGKSSLFNRLSGEGKAVVCEEPGTTRDRVISEVVWQANSFWLMDTAGLLKGLGDEELKKSIEAQIDEVLEEADVLLWVVDGQQGIGEEDLAVWHRIKKMSKKVVLVVNKIDSHKKKELALQERKIALSEKYFVSAKNGLGIGDLLDYLVVCSQKKSFVKLDEKKFSTKMCIVGRPNVGKSTLTNNLCGFERMAVSNKAGTTRDVGEVVIEYGMEKILLMDTAGLRAKGKASKFEIEKYSVIRAIKAMEMADIVTVVIEAVEGLTHQDMVILSMASEMNKGIVLFVNKWDLVEDSEKQRDRFLEKLRRKLGWMWWIPLVFGSAKNKMNLNFLLEKVLDVNKNYTCWLNEEVLNNLVLDIKAADTRMKVIGLTDIKQTKTSPPRFAVGVKKIGLVRYEEERMLKNYIREAFGLYGISLQIRFWENK